MRTLRLLIASLLPALCHLSSNTSHAASLPQTDQVKLTLLVDGPGNPIVPPDKTVFTRGETALVRLDLGKGLGHFDGSIRFVGWAGDATGAATNLEVLMDRDKTVIARTENPPAPGSFQLLFRTGNTPAFGNDGTLYLTDNESLLAIQSTDLALKWKNIFTNLFPSVPAVGKSGRIYVAGSNGSVVAIDPNGSYGWRWEASETYPLLFIDPRPAIVLGEDETVYSYDYEKNVGYAIKDGKKMAELPGIPALMAADATLYLRTTNGLSALAPTGETKWTFTSWAGPAAVGNDGTLYSGARVRDSAAITALLSNGIPKWTRVLDGSITSPFLVGESNEVFVATSAGVLNLSPSNEILWSAKGEGIFGQNTLLPNIPLPRRNGGWYEFSLSFFQDAFLFSSMRINSVSDNGEPEWLERYDSLFSGPPTTGIPVLGPDRAIYIHWGNEQRMPVFTRFAVEHVPARSFWSAPRGTLQNTGRAEPPIRGINITIQGNGRVERSFVGNELSLFADATLTALPQPASRFVRWEGDVKSALQTVSFNVDSHKNIRAIFATQAELNIEWRSGSLVLRSSPILTNAVLEASPDLTHWTNIQTVPDTSGIPISPEQKRQYYRLLAP